ncbi:DUF7535 family protein [Halorientalis halophila]|uniref:DUF7535 family protein n=1 Tax=Halorientalis halophila TaxID=3108499 RepID=UPI003009FE97
MSESETEEATVPTQGRTVTAPYGSGPNAEMDVIGWMIMLGMLVVVVPLLPLVLLYWLVTRAVDFVTEQTGPESP